MGERVQQLPLEEDMSSVTCMGCSKPMFAENKNTRTANKRACEEFLAECLDADTRNEVLGYYDPKESSPICWDCANKLGELLDKKGYEVSIPFAQVTTRAGNDDGKAPAHAKQRVRIRSTKCTGCNESILIRDALTLSDELYSEIDFNRLSRLETNYVNSVFNNDEPLPICETCANEVARIFRLKVEAVTDQYGAVLAGQD